MSFKCGIVGLPNVGKSTLFNALTNAGIEAANYPFCTIKPNVGVVAVPDERLSKIAVLARSQNRIPATTEFVDIAGLVAGAAQGEGLGNAFLANIRNMQAIAHVVRCFDDNNITHVAGEVSPVDDIRTINTELALADLAVVSKAMIQAQKNAKRGDKEAKQLLSVLQRCEPHLNEALALRTLTTLSKEDLAMLQPYQLLTLKPIFYIANVAEDETASARYLHELQQLADAESAPVESVCAAMEAEIAALPASEQHDFLSSLGKTEPSLHRVIRTGYRLLNLQTYFTAGMKEARAWTYRTGSHAVQAAAVIHTDFAKGFIRAEVVAYQDYINCGGEAGAKEAGKWRLEGKEYTVQDGDVIFFRFNV